MRILHLHVKKEYFELIKSGEKKEEFRLRSAFWIRKIEGRKYDLVVLYSGYPKTGDEKRTISLPWRGYTVKTITHPHFGNEPVEVFAIKLA